jgi:hypothetical protein
MEDVKRKQEMERSRVTRLGKFSPIGRTFTLGSFLKLAEVAIDFLATFSQAHPVTLEKKEKRGDVKKAVLGVVHAIQSFLP